MVISSTIACDCGLLSYGSPALISAYQPVRSASGIGARRRVVARRAWPGDVEAGDAATASRPRPAAPWYGASAT